MSTSNLFNVYIRQLNGSQQSLIIGSFIQLNNQKRKSVNRNWTTWINNGKWESVQKSAKLGLRRKPSRNQLSVDCISARNQNASRMDSWIELDKERDYCGMRAIELVSQTQ